MGKAEPERRVVTYDDEWRRTVVPWIDCGYDDAVMGMPEDANPMPRGSLGGEAWYMGFLVGKWPRPLRWVMRWWAKQ